MPNGFHTVPNDSRAVPNGFHAVPNDSHAVPNDFRAVPNDSRAVPNDFRGVPNGFRAVPNDFRGMAGKVQEKRTFFRSLPNFPLPRTPPALADSLPAVRFVICGVGHIGHRHAALVSRHPGATLTALIDVRPELQATLAAEFAGVPFFLSLEAYLQHGPAADVLTVATPNHLHAPQAIQGLRAGLHAVVEKPIALRKRDAEDLVHTALQTGRLVFGVMQNRYSPPAAWLKQVYDEGRLGEIYLVQINCFWNRDARYYQAGGWKGTRQQDGGTLFTQFSHFVDLLYWVFGDIDNIQARFRDFNHAGLTDFEDSGLVTFDLVRGGSGTLQYSTAVWDRNLESSLTVVAERGSLRLGGQYMDKVEYCHLQDYQLPALPPTNPANDYGPYQGSAANHVQVIENVVDTIQKRGFATTNALEGMKVVEIIERIYGLK